MFNNTLGIISVGICVLYAVLGSITLYNSPKNSSNRFFFLYSMLLSFWSINMALLYFSDSTKAALFFYQIGSSAGLLSPTLFYFFVVSLYAPYKKRKYFYLINSLISLLGISIVIIILTLPIYEFKYIANPGYYSLVVKQDWIYYIFFPFIFINLTLGCGSLFYWYFKTATPLAKSQIRILLSFFLIPYLSIFLLGLLPVLFPLGFPEMDHIISLIPFSGFIFAISRYHFLSLSDMFIIGHVLNNLDDYLFLLDVDGKIRQVNRKTVEDFFYPEHYLLSLHIQDLLDRDDRLSLYFNKSLQKNQEKQNSFSVKSFMRNRLGQEIPVLMTVQKLSHSSKHLNGFILIGHDLRNEEKRADLENALQESEALYQHTIKALDEGIIIIDRNLKINFYNSWFADFCRRKLKRQIESNSLLAESLPEVFSAFMDDFLKVFSNREIIERDQTLNVDGEDLYIFSRKIPIIINDSVQQVITVIQDQTERRKNEQYINRSQRIESIGLLASGIAHDFNNLLTSVLGGINLSRNLSNNPQQIELLQLSEEACKKASSLTRQLLSFAKGGAPVKKAGSIRDLIEQTGKFVLSGCQVEINIQEEENLYNLEFDSGQLSNVFHNLFLNSLQAMDGKGKINIKIENARMNKINGFVEGPAVQILFRDNGPGIKPEDQEKIFEPYFTTKETGSGIGLANVYSIISRHQGSISLFSRPGEFAEFRILLPALTDRIIQPELKSRAKPLPEIKRVLVLDDEQEILTVYENFFAFLDIQMDSAQKGEDIIKRYEASLKTDTVYDRIILDLTVNRGMGGIETMAELRKLDPELYVIVASGYHSGPVLANPHKYGFTAVLNKPFMLEDLKKALQEN